MLGTNFSDEPIFASVTSERSWPEQTVKRLRLVEDLFASRLLRWRTEEALNAAQARFQTVTDFMQHWEYWESPEGSILFCSLACQRITGYGPEQFFTQPKLLHEIVSTEDAKLWEQFHSQASSGRPHPRNLQFRIVRADGQVCWIQHHCQAVLGKDGTFLGIRASNRDFTTEKKAEQDRQRLREELARVTRMTMAEQLAASLAHELRQPLAAILSNTEAAQQFLDLPAPDLQEVREALQDIVRNDERASQIIQRLRALYRRTGQQHSLFDLNQLIDETMALLRAELVLRQVTYHLDLEPDLPAVSANRIEIQQVLINLVFNARDAVTERGRDLRQLIVRTAREGSRHLRVSVDDSGPGLAAEMAERLFEPFVTTKEGGMGMGLAISHNIIEAHRGEFRTEKSSLGGASFRFLLPIPADLVQGAPT